MRALRHLGCLGAVALLTTFVSTTTACSTENTCLPGNAMTNPRVLGKVQPSLTGARLRIGWDAGTERGAELPRAYFTAGKVATSKRSVGPDGPTMEERVESDADRELAVIVRGTLAELQGKLKFEITFPDRKQFITCERAESAVDKYGLAVDLELDGQGAVTKSSITEIRAGDE